MRLHDHLAAVAAALSGCGSDVADTKRQGSAVVASPASLTTAEYAKQAAALKTSIGDALGHYFHGRRAPEAVRRQLQDVRAAYADSAEQLAALQPPAAAVGLHRRLLALWRKRAAQVANALSARQYRSSRVSDLMYGTDADNTTYNDIYTLPQ